MMQKPLNIAIVGLGVIGGSFALALKNQEELAIQVMAIDHDPATLERALSEGAIDFAEMENKTILQQADLVIITLYPSAIADFVKKHRAEFKQGAVLMDTAGVKERILEELLPILPKGVDFIFGHPMAGKESQGFAYADGAVFQEANYLITPVAGNKRENIDFLVQILKTLGFKSVRETSPQTHDEMIAFVSQLCHIMAVSLINSDLHEGDTADFVGDTYRELTRIAKINASLWSELFLYNQEELLKAMDNFQEQFNHLKTAIEEEDKESLTEMLVEASVRRIALEQADSKLKQDRLDERE